MLIDYEEGNMPHDNPDYSGVWYKYFIGDEEELYGIIRYEIVPSAAVVHVYPTVGINKTKLKELKKFNNFLFENILIDKWNFEEIYFSTNNLFLVKFLSNNVYEKVGEVDNRPLYRSNIKEILCRLS